MLPEMLKVTLTAWKTILWISVFALAVLVPTGLMLLGEVPPGRGFWVDFGAILGFTAFAVLCFQFITTGRFPRVGKPFGVDTLLHFHRQIGQIAAVLVFSHVLIVIVADPAYLGFFDPRVNAPRAFALIALLLAMAVLIVSSIWRNKLGLSYEYWRLIHTAMASLVVLIALAHLIMVGHFTHSFLKTAVWVTIALMAFWWLFHVRLLKPLVASRKPWQVVEVRPEAESIWTLELEALGHDGFDFKAGQYAWMTIGRSPFQLQQNPFTIASSPSNPVRLEFTIKKMGDFTSNIADIPKGTTAFLEGPYGHLTLREKTAPASVFLAGGIGITLAMSMLRWLKASGSPHPFHLFYAAKTIEKMPFRQELEMLAKEINLRVVYVLECPPDDWDGEKGLLRTDVITRHLPKRTLRSFDYMVCGPVAMAASLNESLRSLGIPKSQQRDERFDMV